MEKTSIDIVRQKRIDLIDKYYQIAPKGITTSVKALLGNLGDLEVFEETLHELKFLSPFSDKPDEQVVKILGAVQVYFNSHGHTSVLAENKAGFIQEFKKKVKDEDVLKYEHFIGLCFDSLDKQTKK